MTAEYEYIKLSKKWAGFREGDVVRCGKPKGQGLALRGFGEIVKRQRAVNEPIIETATRLVTPKPDAKAIAKAREDERRAAAEAKAKDDEKVEVKTDGTPDEPKSEPKVKEDKKRGGRYDRRK